VQILAEVTDTKIHSKHGPFLCGELCRDMPLMRIINSPKDIPSVKLWSSSSHTNRDAGHLAQRRLHLTRNIP